MQASGSEQRPKDLEGKYFRGSCTLFEGLNIYQNFMVAYVQQFPDSVVIYIWVVMREIVPGCFREDGVSIFSGKYFYLLRLKGRGHISREGS